MPPTPPTTPTATMPAMTTTQTAAPAAQPDLGQQMQKLFSNKNPQAMGQVMLLGTLLGCMDKQVGKPATQAFYQEMQTMAKTAEGYCKQGNATQARALVLSTFQAKHNDPVVKAALVCYDQEKANIPMMAGQKMAADAEHYARWIRDPSLAAKEMTDADICKNVKKQ